MSGGQSIVNEADTYTGAGATQTHSLSDSPFGKVSTACSRRASATLWTTTFPDGRRPSCCIGLVRASRTTLLADAVGQHPIY